MVAMGTLEAAANDAAAALVEPGAASVPASCSTLRIHALRVRVVAAL